jgi:hypothetical protein
MFEGNAHGLPVLFWSMLLFLAIGARAAEPEELDPPPLARLLQALEGKNLLYLERDPLIGHHREELARTTFSRLPSVLYSFGLRDDDRRSFFEDRSGAHARRRVEEAMLLLHTLRSGFGMRVHLPLVHARGSLRPDIGFGWGKTYDAGYRASNEWLLLARDSLAVMRQVRECERLKRSFLGNVLNGRAKARLQAYVMDQILDQAEAEMDLRSEGGTSPAVRGRLTPERLSLAQKVLDQQPAREETRAFRSLMAGILFKWSGDQEVWDRHDADRPPDWDRLVAAAAAGGSARP